MVAAHTPFKDLIASWHTDSLIIKHIGSVEIEVFIWWFAFEYKSRSVVVSVKK